MKNLGIQLSWMTVKDLKKSISFYTEIAGFKLLEHSPEFGWAELKGPEGSRLGLCQETQENPIQAGSNTITCITVDNIHAACDLFIKKGITLIGEIMEVPGHVKIQTFKDSDGNTLQLVEKIQ
jgi:predicted enzyme related to lactoylglutathione lyase